MAMALQCATTQYRHRRGNTISEVGNGRLNATSDYSYFLGGLPPELGLRQPSNWRVSPISQGSSLFNVPYISRREHYRPAPASPLGAHVLFFHVDKARSCFPLVGAGPHLATGGRRQGRTRDTKGEREIFRIGGMSSSLALIAILALLGCAGKP
jgi:hypothetical protein